GLSQSPGRGLPLHGLAPGLRQPAPPPARHRERGRRQARSRVPRPRVRSRGRAHRHDARQARAPRARPRAPGPDGARPVAGARRLDCPLTADPFTVYRALRTINPSPYLFFLRLGTLTIVGSSPEVLVRVEGEDVALRPIAGTRPRGATETQDRQIAEELVADPKERAEHVMLVDLGRNDGGRG